MSKSTKTKPEATEILPTVLEYFKTLKDKTKPTKENRQTNPLPNELELINKAYTDIKVLPCERITNHCDHFKFTDQKQKLSVYLTTRDIGYSDYWKFTLVKKLLKNNYTKIVTSSYKKDDCYPRSFIEKISISNDKKTLETTPKDYLTKNEYNGFCRH